MLEKSLRSWLMRLELVIPYTSLDILEHLGMACIFG